MSNQRTREPSPTDASPRRQPAASVGRLGLIVAGVAMAAAHVVQPELDPIHEPVSFYVHGGGGWLLTVALAAFGVAAIALARAMVRLLSARRAAPWLVAFGAGMLLAALVPSDQWFPWEARPSFTGLIHAGAAVVSPPLLLVPMIRLRDRSDQTPLRRRLTHWLLFAYLLGLLGSAVSMAIGWALDQAPPFVGLTERLLAISAFWWFWGITRPNALR